MAFLNAYSQNYINEIDSISDVYINEIDSVFVCGMNNLIDESDSIFPVYSGKILNSNRNNYDTVPKSICFAKKNEQHQNRYRLNAQQVRMKSIVIQKLTINI